MKTVFAERLKELRAEKGLSLNGLAEALGVSGVSIGYYEKGQRVPDIHTLSNMCKFFNVTSDYLIGLTNYRESKDMTAQLKIAEEMRGALCNRRLVLGLGNVLEVTENLWLKIADAVEGKPWKD